MTKQSIGDVFKPNRPRVSPSEKPELPFIGMEHVEAHSMKLLGTVPAETMKSSSVHFQPGDVLYGRLRPYLNKVYRPDFEGLCSAEFIVFPTTEGVNSKYLQYYLNSNDFVTFATHLNEGDRPRVDFKQIAPYPFPLPPLPQQRRIVEAIELQLGRLDAAVARLQGAKARLKRYKQAVLKAAVEGRLTGEWREKNPHSSTGIQWHEQILAARKSSYQEIQISKGKKSPYKAPIGIEALDATDTELGELPDTWTWATADEVTVMITDGEHATPPRTEHGVPLLSARNIQDGWLSFENIDHVSEQTHEKLAKRLRVQGGDVLLSCSGSVGRCCVAPKDSHFSLVRSVAVLRPILEIGAYMAYAVRSPLVQAQINSRKTQTAQANIFQGKIKQLALPIPPLEEQRAIVAMLEETFMATEETETTLDAQLQQAVRLRQAVLKRAFEGRLG